jgi:hypothetical protein
LILLSLTHPILNPDYSLGALQTNGLAEFNPPDESGQADLEKLNL